MRKRGKFMHLMTRHHTHKFAPRNLLLRRSINNRGLQRNGRRGTEQHSRNTEHSPGRSMSMAFTQNTRSHVASKDVLRQIDEGGSRESKRNVQAFIYIVCVDSDTLTWVLSEATTCELALACMQALDSRSSQDKLAAAQLTIPGTLHTLLLRRDAGLQHISSAQYPWRVNCSSILPCLMR